jgi:hypothetical protein
VHFYTSSRLIKQTSIKFTDLMTTFSIYQYIIVMMISFKLIKIMMITFIMLILTKTEFITEIIKPLLLEKD